MIYIGHNFIPGNENVDDGTVDHFFTFADGKIQQFFNVLTFGFSLFPF